MLSINTTPGMYTALMEYAGFKDVSTRNIENIVREAARTFPLASPSRYLATFAPTASRTMPARLPCFTLSPAYMLFDEIGCKREHIDELRMGAILAIRLRTLLQRAHGRRR